MQHLDEGTIHAWLDEQLPPDEAAAVEAHVAECRQCADAVAEARGLIAASSRILMSLDDVPRDVVPKQPMPVMPVMPVMPAVPVAPDAPIVPVTATSSAAPSASTPNAVVDLPSRAAARQPVQPVKRAPRRWLRGPTLAAAATIVVAVGTFALTRAGSRKMGSPSIIAEDAGPSGRAVDSAALSVPTSAPASVPSAEPLSSALGTARANDAQPAPRAAAPSLAGARVELDQSAARDRAPQRTDGLSAGKTASSVAANAPARDELKRETKVADLPVLTDQPARFAKERAAIATDSLGRQRQLATIPPAPAPAPQARRDTTAPPSPPSPPSRAADAEKASEQRVTVFRGSAAMVTAGTIRGRVTDGNSTPLAGASVTVAGTSIGVAASESGDFLLAGVPPGPHSLAVRRVGYEPVTRDITVVAGQTTTTTVTLKPVATSLQDVVVTASGATRRADRASAGSATAPVAPRATAEAAPGAAITAGQSTAVGCYEMGITPNSQQARLNFRQTPRRVALDAEIVPSNADGVWYRARDLARTGAVPNGLWRPVGTDGIELEWTYGTRFARIRLTGPVGQMMRGTAEEIDRANGTGEAGAVVSVRASCAG